MTSQPDFVWNGKHEFSIEGTDHHEDTLRIENNYKDKGIEQPLELHLPTLCITYAVMGFANAVGGLQRGYPGSAVYGPAHFNPPVEISGEQDVEKFTWIRGSHKVVIGPDETVIYWYPKNVLVIPRLRVEEKEPVVVFVAVNAMPVAVDRPLQIDVSQYADGRSTGGLRIEKQHPKWVPDVIPETYDLWVRVMDGEAGAPIPEAKLNIFRWDEGAQPPSGTGCMQLIDQLYTDGSGAVSSQQRPSGQVEAVVLNIPGWRAVVRSFRSFPAQNVNFYMTAWKMRENVIRYTLKSGDNLSDLAAYAGCTSESILIKNSLSDASLLVPGLQIDLPCFAGTYRLEEGDNFQWLAEAFAYKNVEELAMVNGWSDPVLSKEDQEIELTGWHFFHAKPGASLENLEKMFGLPVGWVRYVGRVYHPDDQMPMAPEIVAVPTMDFVKSHSQ